MLTYCGEGGYVVSNRAGRRAFHQHMSKHAVAAMLKRAQGGLEGGEIMA